MGGHQRRRLNRCVFNRNQAIGTCYAAILRCWVTVSVDASDHLTREAFTLLTL